MLSEQPTLGTRGMVACAHYLATQAGLQILTQGGNAIDAAIAANAVMTVVYPSTCSAGGDVFMLIWEAKTQQLHALNGSGRAPQGMTPRYFASRGMQRVPERGPLPITVPGAVDGWFEALSRFGTLSAETIFAPAIGFAEEGIAVSPKLGNWLSHAAKEVLQPWESSVRVFLPHGQPLHAGEILRQPDLARTYRTLAKEGRDVFYRGPMARSITNYVQRCGGVLSMQDMEQHHSDWVAPISTNYRGYDVYEFPPNTQGIAALEMLNILEGYDLKSLGYQSAEYLHIGLEAKKLAFADRDTYVSDPAFVDVPVEQLLSKTYAEQQRARINPKRATPYYAGGLEKEGDTMYLCVADRAGNVVSLIQSLSFGFGSGIVGGDSGVLLHNRGSYFFLDPRHVNYLQPGKRTMHTLTPAMVLRNGRPYMAIGSMGGDGQPQIHVQLLSAIIDFGFNVQQAISAPRWRSSRYNVEPPGTRQEMVGQRAVDEGAGSHEASIRAPLRSPTRIESAPPPTINRGATTLRGATGGHDKSGSYGPLEGTIVEIVLLEDRFLKEVPLALELLGHQPIIGQPWEDAMGHAQAIVINPSTRVFEGAADPRCDGLALGW